ncbi:MAG: hypothetical protein N3B13_08210 [Deltaproteobacteria bacterium]|nr:hypothetical protein [Deltaproteobacteria bacterium]
MQGRNKKKKKKIPFRIEPMKRPSRPIGTKKGKKGYNRKRDKYGWLEEEDYGFES